MKRFFYIILYCIISVNSFAQVPRGDLDKLSPAEKIILKMMFKSFEDSALSEVFDSVSEEFNIKELSSSKYEGMELIAICFIENEDMEFSTEDSEKFNPDSFVYGKLEHYTGKSVRHIQAESKDKKQKVCEYIVTAQGVTFLVIYKAPLSSFSKGINAANNVAINIKRK